MNSPMDTKEPKKKKTKKKLSPKKSSLIFVQFYLTQFSIKITSNIPTPLQNKCKWKHCISYNWILAIFNLGNPTCSNLGIKLLINHPNSTSKNHKKSTLNPLIAKILLLVLLTVFHIGEFGIWSTDNPLIHIYLFPITCLLDIVIIL